MFITSQIIWSGGGGGEGEGEGEWRGGVSGLKDGRFGGTEIGVWRGIGEGRGDLGVGGGG